jgi:glutamate--cysteine ligase
MTTSYQTPGYEQLELSTQLVIAEALKRGVKVEVLDEASQFIRLTKGKHIEYVQEATKTSLDSYVTSLILGNKWVSKQILEEQGIKVPKAFLFTDEATARSSYGQFSSGQWVVKPKTTNFGIGISMLRESAPQSHFEEAVRSAFRHDQTILLEQFIEGKEYRFLVIDDEVIAVLNRVPANVVGDGKHSIQELVDKKNEDPRRGKGYKTPLEKIELGKTELAELKSKGMYEGTVPEDGVQVLLRKNSNISTGGDSIDATDEMDNKYKKIAVRASQAVGAKICGVDMIIGEDHGIIELNFNPVLYFHDFPYEGKNRHTGKVLLDALGF